jgi:hypothetical protein
MSSMSSSTDIVQSFKSVIKSLFIRRFICFRCMYVHITNVKITYKKNKEYHVPLKAIQKRFWRYRCVKERVLRKQEILMQKCHSKCWKLTSYLKRQELSHFIVFEIFKNKYVGYINYYLDITVYSLINTCQNDVYKVSSLFLIPFSNKESVPYFFFE